MQAVFTGGNLQMGDWFIVVKTDGHRRSKMPNISTIKTYGTARTRCGNRKGLGMTDETPPTKKSLAALGDMLKKQEKTVAAKGNTTTRTIETQEYTITYRKRAFGEG
jgi:hypothetical protein